LAKFYQNPSSQEISINFSLFPTHRKFPKFLFEIYFESEEVSISKVVPYLKYFSVIFYFKFLNTGRYILNQSKFGEILNPIEPFKFLNRSKPFELLRIIPVI
jgi:hypothetical protein